MVSFTSLAAGVAVFTSVATADLTCAPYTPVGWSSGAAKVEWTTNNPTGDPAEGPSFRAPTLPANASVGNPWKLSNHSTSTGYAFNYLACNSTSLAISSPQTQSSCSDSGCYHTYTNYVHIVNPATGHCLTAQNWNATSSKFVFRPCDAAASNSSQLYETTQQVLYTADYGSITSYGTVELNNVLLTTKTDTRPYDRLLAWVLSRSDNRTIEVIQYQYSQDGLGAALVQA